MKKKVAEFPSERSAWFKPLTRVNLSNVARRDIAWALDIVGIGEGPADLSQRAREYLYGDK